MVKLKKIESAKLRALRAKNVLACQRALRVYVSCVLTYLACLHAHVPTCLACLPALRAYVLTCKCALRTYVLTC